MTAIIARVAPDPVVDAERVVAEAWLAPVWAAVVAERPRRGVIAHVVRRKHLDLVR